MEKLQYDLAIALLDEMDCVALTDATGRYIYQNRGWYERRTMAKQDTSAVYPWDILEDSMVYQVIKTQEKVIGHIIKSGNQTSCVNYHPIFRNNKFFGVLIWTFFTGIDIAQCFAQQVNRLTNELERTKLLNRNLVSASYSISNIIGESAPILALKEEITSVARTGSNVLIEGETGVGKELVAHAIHDLSRRSKSRFVRVNCSAIPTELMESEFFGYAPGAFTGASKKGKPGKFEIASGGSLFLDEVNSMPTFMQPKLLRVIQEKEVDRIGGNNPIPVDTRIITASNTSLEEQVEAGLFRQDLYYRLNVVRLRVPPLRERREDIPILVRYFLSKLNYELGTEISAVDDELMDTFLKYDWPGNIRELRNVLEHAMNYANGDTILPSHAAGCFRDLPHTKDSRGSAKNLSRAAAPTLGSKMANAEREELLRVLEECGGNRSAAAKHLGIARSTFYRKLEQHGL